MKPKIVFLRVCIVSLTLCSAALAADSGKSQVKQSSALPGPELKIVEKWRGTWDVKATRRQPQPIEEVTYVESFDWVLDGRYLRSETSRKSDGGQSMSIFWHDMFTKTYRFVIFDAMGLAVELPPPTWKESTQTMDWKSGLFAPISYTGYATFTDPDTIRWKALWKDWKGTVILDLDERVSVANKRNAMPSSQFLFHSGLGIIALISILALAASFLTVLASAFLVWRYRRTVAKLMEAQSGEAEHRMAGGTHAEPASSPARQDSEPHYSIGERHVGDRLYRLTIVEPRRHACKYALGGVLFALVMGVASFFAFSQTQVNYLRAAAHPFQCLFLFWTFVWPIVLTSMIVAGPSRRSKCLMVLTYFMLLVVTGGMIALTPTEAPYQASNVSLPAWSGETPMRLLHKWNLFNLAPTLLLVTFRNRRVRAVAPLVLGFMTIVSVGVLGILSAAFIYQETSVAAIAFASETFGVSVIAALIGYFLLLSAVAGLLFSVLGWGLLIWMRSAYQRKAVSDQSLGVDALWLVFAAFYAAMLALAGPGWALSALVAFVVFKIAVSVCHKQLRSKSDNCHDDPALLVLRVFALGKRSERLFDAVTKRWRHVGNVRLIAGTDLALSTVAPHQFLAFISGKLGRLFIGDEPAMDRNLAELDTRRDADGRFRINDFFCHADTWQRVLSWLVTSTDVVVMGLRSFTENNTGCVFEIKELLNTVPLGRLVFVIDDTTDKPFLKQTLADVCRELRHDSPNLGVSSAAVKPFELAFLRHTELQGLLRQLCAAVGAGSMRSEAGSQLTDSRSMVVSRFGAAH